MPGVKQYNVKNVAIIRQVERRSSWKWNGHAIRGSEITYKVIDYNFDRLNIWMFTVKVPTKLGQVVIQPQAVPGKKAFSDLQRRSIIFVKATKHPYRRKLYCKAFVADPTGEKNRLGISRGRRNSLPNWFRPLFPSFRLKQTVATTAGTDGESQVILVAPTDYKKMVRVYFALRVWVLQEHVLING
ncbi:MAG: hypothetical protein JWN24_3713 [Phycisphaerales bacterium]|nr:hypothetical protein [Phycisphaerales bacterium]